VRSLQALGLMLGLMGLAGVSAADELPPLKGRTNLAAGRPVIFSPTPNYYLTRQGDTDAADLTDGRLTQREDRHMWFEPLAVGWSYAGRVNLAVDLGEMAAIEEIAIRFLGGSPQHGISFPGWVEAFVSEDREKFVKVAEFSRWREGDFIRFGVPEERGEAWVHCLRFTGLNVHGRWVGLRFYGTGLTCSDELFVFGTSTDKSATATHLGSPSGFTVSHPQPYFHKPTLLFISNLPAPVPLGIVVPESLQGPREVRLTLDLPEGVELTGGHIGGVDLSEVRPQSLADGYRRYAFTASVSSSDKTWGRLYLRAPTWHDGQEGRLRYGWAHGDWRSPTLSVPIRVTHVPPAPRLKHILISLGWWSSRDSTKWPDVLRVWRHLGLNGFPLFTRWIPKGADTPEWRLLEEARKQGFFIVGIDSPFHRLLYRRKGEAEIYCQFEDGSHGDRLCPSYRGRFYREEIQRLAKECAQIKPDFLTLDIELWTWRGPTDSRRCKRCREDFRRSGLDSWERWQERKGFEMWCDLIGAVRKAVREAGGSHVDVGGYDFRPGLAYQYTWPFDRLYPRWMGESQVSTYTCLYPYHLEVIGDEVRRDRALLPRSDVIPWITPGDAGTFPGEAFRWALLECFVNGSRGIYFWSGRVWDAESLVALNEVIRAVAPIEEIIVNGELAGEAVKIEGPGRASGMKKDGEMVLLVADYFRHSDGTLRVRIHLERPAKVVDLFTGQTLAERLPAGNQALIVPLDGERARLLHVKRLEDTR